MCIRDRDTDDVPSIVSQVKSGAADVALTVGPRWIQHIVATESTDQFNGEIRVEPLLYLPCGLVLLPQDEAVATWLDTEAARIADHYRFEQETNQIELAYEDHIRRL